MPAPPPNQNGARTPSWSKVAGQEGLEDPAAWSTDSCYEVYAKTPDGKRVEAFFDPKTL